MKNKLRKVIFCLHISLRMALNGFSKISSLYFLGLFTSALIIFSLVSSAELMLSSGSVRYKEPDKTFLLYFEDEKYLEPLRSFTSPIIVKRGFAQVRMQQVFSGGFSKVSSLVSLDESCADLVKGVPDAATAVMKAYDMQKLHIRNGDKISIDGQSYTVLYDPSLSFEDAGVVIRNNAMSGKSMFLCMFVLQDASDMNSFHQEIASLMGRSIKPYAIQNLNQSDIYYASAARRLSIFAQDKSSSLVGAAVLSTVFCLYILLNMLNIARYHAQKEHIEYAVCRLFAGKKTASLQFFFEVLPVSLLSLVLAWWVSGWFMSGSAMGVTGIAVWSPRLLLYALPPHCILVLLLELLVLRNKQKKNIAECLTGFSN